MEANKEIRLYDADSLEYSGSILVDGPTWRFSEVKDQHLVETATGLPLKTVLMCLISFNLVYDIIQDENAS